MALKPGQEKCINTLDVPLAVAAGAGSGKTFTLTQRIAHALESGYVSDIDQVLAITFTNKAAAELKSRLKSELRSRGMVDQALKVDEAWVSTIHGMCARILRAHALQLGIDPAFKVADPAQLDALLSTAIDAVVSAAELEGDARALDALFNEYPARSFGYNASVQSMLTDLVGAALATGKGIEGVKLPAEGSHPVQVLQEVIDEFASLADEASGLKQSKSSAEWIDVANAAIKEAQELLGSNPSDANAILQVLFGFSTKRTFGTADFKEHMSHASTVLTKAMLSTRLFIARSHLETLVVLAKQVMELFTALKRAEGVLDNTDLLTLAARAIEQHPDIAALYVDKFKLVMVDEFQDTDQMQVDMIKRLAGAGFSRLCVVGDAQQSIYRFRGADVSVYRRHLQSVVEQNPSGVIELPDNFRSHADVLAFVDRVFEQPSMFGGSFMSLKASREKESDGWENEQLPRINVLVNARPYQGGDKELAAALGPKRIAKTFARYAKTHAVGEMALLLGAMRRAGEYAQALRDEGLACVISGGSVFAGTLEAQMVLDLVHICANPHDTLALFNVLAGPMFELQAGDLLALATRIDDATRRVPLDAGLAAFERRLFEEGSAGMSVQLACAVRVLSNLKRDIVSMPVAQAIGQAVVDSGWLTRMENGGAIGQSQAANVYKALRMVEQLQEDESLGCAALARRFEAVLTQSKEAPGALSATGGDFVRIMTVHASKGLEFPIVGVAEFRATRAQTPKLQLANIDGCVYASLDLDRSIPKNSTGKGKVTDVAAELYGEDVDDVAVIEASKNAADPVERAAALYEYEARGSSEEAKRLLYVALTRAREALVVSVESTWSAKSNPNGMPANVFASIATALDPENGCFTPGRTLYDFKGSAPAVVEMVKLPANEEDAEDVGDLLFATLVESEQESSGQGEGTAFVVPLEQERPKIIRVPFSMGRRGVFSYSSIAEASHKTDVLSSLANRFCSHVDASGEQADGQHYAGNQENSAGLHFTWDMPAAFDVEDEYLFGAPGSPDSDKATDLGTAFHRLAQYAVCARVQGEQLELPPADRVEALSTTCNLGAEARARLDDALERWFESDIAHEMAKSNDLRAEVPFYEMIEHGKLDAPIYLEGEIDLLALDENDTTARVVDYKTGGHADEAIEQLAEKHVLQASCYAYALLRQGLKAVDAVFVRVERVAEHGDNQPQCVRYHFEISDLPVLEEAIVDVNLAQ